MKKKVIVICIILLFVVIGGIFICFSKDSKVILEKSKKIISYKLENETSKTTMYVASVPKVDQEYTILYDDGVNALASSLKSETIEDAKVDNCSETENDFIQNETAKEEISVVENNENINANETEETLSIYDENSTENDEKTSIEDFTKINKEQNNNVLTDDTSSEVVSSKDELVNLKNGFYEEEGNTYYYENDARITGLKNIDGINNYFSPSGKYLGTNNIKVIDVSYYQNDIDWDLFAKESDCYGVILRLGYYETLDKRFERNISELKRLGIPYGIYLFSYASTLTGAKKEADFTNKMITKYDINPTLGIYYDIESWSTKTSNSNNITKSMYDDIIQHYVNSVGYYTNYKYRVKVYSGRWYAMNRLGNASKKYVDWVAEYNKTCKYDETYSMWQYTSKGSVPGIEGNVDISYIL